jgi:hypothetical protein
VFCTEAGATVCFHKNTFRVSFKSILLLLTPQSRVVLEELLAAQLVEKFLNFGRTQMFVTVFSRSAQAQTSLDTGIPSNPHSLIPKSLPLVPILSQSIKLIFSNPFF